MKRSLKNISCFFAGAIVESITERMAGKNVFIKSVCKQFAQNYSKPTHHYVVSIIRRAFPSKNSTACATVWDYLIQTKINCSKLPLV